MLARRRLRRRAIHAPTLTAFAERFAPFGFRETSFLPGYGLAEHVVAATFVPRDRRLRTDGALVSCGVPLPDHRLRIVDDSGIELAEREVGEITLAGPSVMHGYYQNGALTQEAVRDGWLHTGDLGYLADGEITLRSRERSHHRHGTKLHRRISRGRRGLPAFGAAGAVESRDPDAKTARLVVVVEPEAPSTLKNSPLQSPRLADITECKSTMDSCAERYGGASRVERSRAMTKARYESGEIAARRRLRRQKGHP